MDEQDFREALGCFATGITVITTYGDDGAPIGMTANSFNSVSLDPPLVLFSIAKSSERFSSFANCERFAVNILNSNQEEYSINFSKTGVNGFDQFPYRDGEYGCPLLQKSLAHFECERSACHEGGDHVIMVGRVRALEHSRGGGALVYFRGRYMTLD